MLQTGWRSPKALRGGLVGFGLFAGFVENNNSSFSLRGLRLSDQNCLKKPLFGFDFSNIQKITFKSTCF